MNDTSTVSPYYLLWLAALPEGSVRVLPVAEQNRPAVERYKRSTLRRPGDALEATTSA
jgi:hypothetical protein